MKQVGDYIMAQHSCWRCGADITVYSWVTKTGLWDDEVPPEPRPVTVQKRYTEGMGAYWVNVCGLCGAVQGDFFLYMEPDGPFFGLELGAASPKG